MVIGGQAVLFYDLVRMTRDVDITLGVGREGFPKLSAVCKVLKLKILVKEPQSFVGKTHVLPALDVLSGLRVDFIFSNTPYETQAIRRAKRIRIGRTRVAVSSLEDLLIHKLVAGRPIDIEDARILLAKHRGKVDLRYVRGWLRQFAALGTLRANPLTTLNTLQKSL